MATDEYGMVLRVFLGETDRRDGRPLYEIIVLRAQEMGLAGATVFRGLMGYGAHQQVHTAKVLRLSEDLPIVVEIVDTEERLRGFLEWLDGVMEEGTVMLEKAEVRRYRRAPGG